MTSLVASGLTENALPRFIRATVRRAKPGSIKINPKTREKVQGLFQKAITIPTAPTTGIMVTAIALRSRLVILGRSYRSSGLAVVFDVSLDCLPHDALHFRGARAAKCARLAVD